MEIPKKITPCPIVEAIVEIRFESDVPGDAIFGLLYSVFKKDYSNIERLPILQLPEQIRNNEPNLAYKPCYKLSSDNMIIQIGPKVFSLVNVKEYIGWDAFSVAIKEVFGKFYSEVNINKINRLAVRYINLFEEVNLFKQSELKILLRGEDFSENEINLTSNITGDNSISKLIMVNHGQVSVGNKHLNGSLIDIDTVLNKNPAKLESDIEIFMKCINQAHADEKKLFFSLLSSGMLNSLNPIY